jgi:hypothetical protein
MATNKSNNPAAVMPDDDGTTTWVPLLNMESWYMMLEKSITTATFFRFADRPTADRALAALRERLHAVVLANPWIAGRVVKDKKRHKNTLLKYPTTATQTDTEQILDVVTDPTNALALVDESTPLTEMLQAVACSPATLPPGSKLLGKPMAVSKFTVVIREKETGGGGGGGGACSLLLVASIIHGVADGHTYYRILAMLSHKTQIVSLSTGRKEKTDEIIKVVGAKEYKYMAAPALGINFVASMLLGKKSTAHAFLVDEEKVTSAKTAEAANLGESGGFVSTNDILTSTFANATRARIFFMAVNWRGRIAGLEDDDAGNYEAVCTYDPDSYNTAAAIRKSLTSKPGRVLRVPSDRALPKFCESVRCRFYMMTTWVFPFFNGELQLLPDEPTPLAMHVPVYLAQDQPMNFAVVFRIRKDTKAVLYFLTDVTEEQLRNNGAPIGDEL